MYEKANYIINIHVNHTYDAFLIFEKNMINISRNCVYFQQFQRNLMNRRVIVHVAVLKLSCNV